MWFQHITWTSHSMTVSKSWPFLICNSFNHIFFFLSPIQRLSDLLPILATTVLICSTQALIVLYRHNLTASHWGPLTFWPGHFCHYFVKGPWEVRQHEHVGELTHYSKTPVNEGRESIDKFIPPSPWTDGSESVRWDWATWCPKW